MRRKLLISLALLSASIIAFQLVLMQILSITQWYHFAYMVISVALLGFGTAGTVLAIFRKRLLNLYDSLLPLFMLLCSIAIATVAGLSQTAFFSFDSYLVFVEGTHVGKLILTYLLFFVPFFFGAMAIGMIFTQEVVHIGRMYFANLVGSAAGGILILFLFTVFLPVRLPAVVAIMSAAAGMLLVKRYMIMHHILALLSCIVIGLVIMRPPQLHISQYKDISKTLLLPDASIGFEENSPHGLLQTVTSPALRYGPGMSLTSTQAPPVEAGVFVNGDWLGPLIGFDNADVAVALDHTTMSLPFVTGRRRRVLILQAGTGIQLSQAMAHRSEKIVLVEANGAVTKVLYRQVDRSNASKEHNIQVIHNESRNYIARDTALYDLITIPMIGAFGGSNGIYSTMEQFLLTREGFDQMLGRLANNGVLSISCWMDYPVRNPLKILATIREVLVDRTLDVRTHVAAVRSWGTITFIVKEKPLTDDEIGEIRAFCDSMHFDPLLLPGIGREERTKYNALQDSSLFRYIDEILAPGKVSLYADYDFRIRPATDNKPYFSQFLRWNSLNKLSDTFGSQMPFFEIGYLLVILTLFQITVIAIVLIILPLFRLGWKGGNKLWVLLYFGGIGLGYMFVEIVLIQRLVLYLGSPVYAASATISAMLLFSGVGSYLSEGIFMNGKRILPIFSGIILLLLIYAFSLTPILQYTIGLPLFLKVLLLLVLIGPLALLMGMPFPSGLSLLSKIQESSVPWAWGVNGCLSVISAALATVVAVEFGFIVVMLIAAVAYGLPLLASRLLRRAV